MSDELPCNSCDCGYGEYSPNWCPLLGRVIKTIDDIPQYHARIPALGKITDGCMGLIKKPEQ